ncbi:MAG: ribosomal RNA small subunit methyltransferase A [Omnitrophica WOR_2 bacterium RIFCSPHIGHO2_02_FULL_50_17]|nr:MAG: ribosomal RNA small subunit methyltransferase A [Omnitrophica WOR_2 bacterium RIFCSPHIGHO2_02_FULL_50_17]
MISHPTDPHAFIPKKSLGQHFLVGPGVRQKIIEACDLRPDDVVLEIGPGKGALTRPLSERVSKVFAVEKDDRLAARLKQEFAGTNVAILHADILEYPFERLPCGVKIVGNLPYNIATPIIEKVLAFRRKFTAFYMTVQWEYGSRMAAGPHSKEYGSLSCFVQYYADVKKLFKIPPAAFMPPPKVQSCFLRLDMKERPPLPAGSEEWLFKVIRTCFNQRRKMVQNSLSSLLPKKEIDVILQGLHIDSRLRAEDISLEDYVRLADRARQG